MMSHDELLDNVAAYALGTLPPSEAALVAKHLESCVECREEYAFLRPAVTALAYSAQACADADSGATAPSPLLRARIMREVRADAQTRQAIPRVWAAYAIAAACLALAIVTGLADLSLDRRVNGQAQVLADFTAPDSRHYGFAGGQVVTHGDRLYLTMRDLPTPPNGRVYQAWTLPRGSKRVAPSSTFEPVGGTAVIRLPQSANTVVAVAVSVEPEGGSKQPTTKPIALVRI